MVEKLVIFGVGAVVGGAAAYIYTKKKYERICEDEIASMKAFYEEPHEPPKKEEKKKEAPSAKYQINAEINRAKANYAQITKDYLESPDPEEQAAREWLENPYPSMGEEAPKEGIDEAPYVITGDQFVKEKRNFDKITLYYYEGNATLVDQTESTKEDIDELIGRESLNHFGEEDDDALYVRNERLNCDYEVLLVHESYKPPYPIEDDIY